MQTAVASIPAPRLGRWANANELPVIDFAPLGGRNAEAIDRIAREVHDACRDIGFLTIVNHPVPPAKIKEIFRQSQRFFALPLADKMKAYMGHSNLFRGDLPMAESAALVASVFARGLKLPADYFAQFYKKPLIQVRLLHYLPQETQAALEGGDSRAHQDAGGFTMLQQDDVGGLEIKTKSGEWLIVPPVENNFVLNIGDSMRMWTKNRFASTLHRVVNHSGPRPYSVALFPNPTYE